MITGTESIAHIIQVALTPIFLLVGVASLLNVFSTRHSYVTAHVDQVLTEIRDRQVIDRARTLQQLENLRRRSRLLDTAVVLGVLAGASTCVSAVLLLVNEIRNQSGQSLLVIFGAALVFTIAALVVFVAEMSMSGKGLRAKIVWAEDASVREKPPELS